MPAPATHRSPAAHAVFDQVAPERRSSTVDLLYITDRTADTSAGSETVYGEGRSKSLAFGSAAVELVPNMGWADLRRESLAAPRVVDIVLELGRVRELGSWGAAPPSPTRSCARPLADCVATPPSGNGTDDRVGTILGGSPEKSPPQPYSRQYVKPG
jgi:hypothetical protein